MLPKEHRLTDKKEFNYVFRQGWGLRSEFFIAKIVKNDRGVARFGFVVSKRLVKKATGRNLIKRRMSEAVKFFLNHLQGGPDCREKSYDVVIIAQPAIIGKKFQEIQEEMKSLLCKSRAF